MQTHVSSSHIAHIAKLRKLLQQQATSQGWRGGAITALYPCLLPSSQLCHSLFFAC